MAGKATLEVTLRLSPKTLALLARLLQVAERRAQGPPNSASDPPESTRPRRGELDVFRGDYVPFAVAALENLHGRARRKAIIDEARQLLGARLKPDDFKRVSERKRLPRWRYRLGWALSQARQRGYLKKVAGERGVRVLTAEGKRAAAAARERIERTEI